MKKVTSFVVLLAVCMTTPIGANAQSVRRSIRAQSSLGTVSQGDFVRMAVHSLGIDRENTENVVMSFSVPEEYKTYFAAAQRRDALRVFNGGVKVNSPISKGQAIRVVVELLGIESDKAVSFRDVRRGTMEEKAVKVIMEKQWLEPHRDGFFGIRRRITKTEAQSLLESAKTVQPVSKGGAQISIPNFKLKVEAHKLAKGIPKEDLMKTVWELLNDEYLYNDKLDQEEAAYKALEAIVNSLDDPYTKYLRPVNAQNFQTQIGGEISGIGAQVEERAGVVTVVTPLTGSPAEQAGIKPNDEILEANGESLKGLQFIEAVNKIRGPTGSMVELKVRRNGAEIFITVKRDVVKIPEIEITWHNKIAVVKLMQFGKLTDTKLREQMVEVQKKNPKGIILDVRNNPGGLLHAASNVVSNFLPKDSAFAKIELRNSNRTDRTEHEPTIDPDVKVVVLVNEGSASASEIVAGALQDHKRAILVGTKTFGKGTVQQVVQFTDQSNLKMTVAEWLTPDGNKIDGIGLEPDFKVEYANERDSQFLRALELLR